MWQGIGLTISSDVIAVFGRGKVAGFSNHITKGSFLLFLGNLIGIIVVLYLFFSSVVWFFEPLLEELVALVGFSWLAMHPHVILAE